MRQIERLQQAIAKAAHVAGSSRAGGDAEDFERLRDTAGRSNAKQEIEQLREDAQRLVEAWKYLENEATGVDDATGDDSFHPGSRHGGNGSPTRRNWSAASRCGCRRPERLQRLEQKFGGIAGGATIQKAQLQFQQLRREMQRHAQQRKKY